MLVFKAHAKPIHGLAFAPDGRHLATSSEDATVILWAIDGPTEVRRFPGSDFDAPIAFSPDGRFLARGGWAFALLEVDSGKRVATGSAGYTVAFAPDGKEVAAFGPLARWALPKGRPLPGGWGRTRANARNRRYAGNAMAYAPDGKVIATAFRYPAGFDFTPAILLWDRKTGKPRGELAPAFTRADPAAIAYSPDGAVIAGVYDAVLGVIDAATGATVAVFKTTKKHFKGLAFTPDGKRLIAVNNDAAARVYDTATWTEATGYEWEVGKLTAVAVAPDGLRAACGSDRGRVVVWDLDA